MKKGYYMSREYIFKRCAGLGDNKPDIKFEGPTNQLLALTQAEAVHGEGELWVKVPRCEPPVGVGTHDWAPGKKN